MEMKLEVIVIPVADVDRAKSFYAGLGWRPDGDFVVDEGLRVVQFTPPVPRARSSSAPVSPRRRRAPPRACTSS